MDARHRMTDVIQLRCHICQEFLKLVIAPDWRDKLYAKAKDQVENNLPSKNKYIPVYERMRDVGKEQYRIEDMDVSLISEIIWNCPNIVRIESKTRNALKPLTFDRNSTDHSGENEADEELYLQEIISLCNLRDFVRAVDKNESSIQDSLRVDFRSRNFKKIEELKELLDDERIELVHKSKKMDKDIESILSSGDESAHRWSQMMKYYHEQALIYHDINIETQFTIKASDAGVKEAHLLSAILFYSSDIAEYENRLYLAYNALEGEHDYRAPNLISQINHYLSERYEHVLTERMKEIVDGMIEKGYPVSISDDGYVLFDGRFWCSPKPINVKKYMYFINEMIIKKGHKLSDDYMKDIEKYTKNGFPITRGDDGLYLWNGKAIQETLTKIDINGRIGYSFD